jgi:signal transduction histidine kinase
VATGRSRYALFFARVPGAWAIVLPLLALAVALAAVIAGVLDGPEPAPTADDIVSGAAQVLTAGALTSAVCVGLAALTGSRGRARVALAVVLVAVAVPVATPFALISLVPLYYAARAGSRRTAVVGTAAVVAAVAAQSLLWGDDQPPSTFVSVTALALAASALGLWSAARREHAAREGELLADRAAAEERLRIARELHDAVGHDVSLMVVQAQALGATVSRVREATDAIADRGRRTMAELHRSLRLLCENGEDGDDNRRPGARLADGGDDARRPGAWRTDGDDGRRPGVGLADLDGLVERARAAGVPLSVTVDGAPRALAPGVDQSAFRIVQEAVTNVVKHADRAETVITLGYGPAALELTIADAGGGVPAGTPGHGLVGMRERAALFGGTLTAAAREGGGFEVRAVLPYGGGE